MSDARSQECLTSVPCLVQHNFEIWSARLASLHSEAAEGDDDQLLVDVINVIKDNLNKDPRYRAALRDVTCSSVTGACCNSSVADSHGKKGTAAYLSGRCDLALRFFTSAIAFLDETQQGNDTAAAKCYSNRALCLLHLHRHQEALEDTISALEHNRNSEAAAFRRAVALHRLRRPQEALNAAKQALAITALKQDHSCARDAQALVDQLAQCSLTDSVRDMHIDGEAEDTNAALPDLKVSLTKSEGRALVLADRLGVRAGALLLTEQPCATALLKKQRRQVLCSFVHYTRYFASAKDKSHYLLYTYSKILKVSLWVSSKQLCAFCLERLPEDAGVPCQACPLAYYCCAAHREMDEQHVPGKKSSGCGVPWSVLLPEQLTLAVRLAQVC